MQRLQACILLDHQQANGMIQKGSSIYINIWTILYMHVSIACYC